MSEIKPALTGEEWALSYSEGNLSIEPGAAPGLEGRLWVYILDACEYEDDDGKGYTDAGIEVSPTMRHALAALALHGQDFGFTWKDVDHLEWILRENPHIASWWDGSEWLDYYLKGLIARIAALLPPRDT